jgi:polyisoprenoid-binding protein YceI
MMALLRAAMIVGLSLLCAPAGIAAEWIVDASASRIVFSGTHTGRAFSGSFQRWGADITFDPDHLESSKAIVRVDLASASVGNATYDKTLPTADWLDTARSAVAVFETTSFRTVAPGRPEGDGAYEADGTLAMRGAKLPVALVFDLKIDGDVARVSGRASLKRLDFGIGRMSDPEGVWIALQIPVEITLVARRKR